MTRFETGGCTWYGYLLVSELFGNVTISLPNRSTVRTMLYSSRDYEALRIVGLQISVGDTYASSTQCLHSFTGYSSWITCNGGLGAVGSNIYMFSSWSYIEVFEMMAFSEQNVTQNAWISDSTPALSGSSTANLLKTEMTIQTGTSSTCFTSVTAPSPFITIQFPAAIPLSVFIAVC
jgi:hypothetical protein